MIIPNSRLSVLYMETSIHMIMTLIFVILTFYEEQGYPWFVIFTISVEKANMHANDHHQPHLTDHQVDGYDRGAEVPEGRHGGDRHVRHLDPTNCRWLHYAIHEHWGEDREIMDI